MELRRRVLVVLAASVAAASAELAFSGTFEEGSALAPFVLSENSRYEGQSVSVQEGALVLEEANHFYGVGAAAALTPASGLAIQFEVQLTDGLSCGGAYVKLLEEGADPKTFDDETPFVVMFGPDKCGQTDKVHFIVRSQNAVSKEWQEHHLKKAPRVVSNDKLSHLYAAVLKSDDDSLEILIDGESVFSGNLFDDFEPPLIPEKEIDDPSDSKPADWVDAAKIPDPDAVKPEDWDEDAPRRIQDPDASKPEGWLDSEPLEVPDPTAEKPEDWDDEEDGEWEAPDVANPKCDVGCGPWEPPMIENPDYKGKWVAPLVENPDYKGEWAPKRIANPRYHDVTQFTKTHMKSIGVLAVDVWTTNKGITYDNFALGTSAKDTAALTEQFLAKKKAQQAEEEQRKQDKKRQRQLKKQKSGLLPKLKGLAEDFLDAAVTQPTQVATAVGVVLLTLFVLYYFRPSSKKTTTSSSEQAASSSGGEASAAAAAAAEKKEDDDEADDDAAPSKPPMAD